MEANLVKYKTRMYAINYEGALYTTPPAVGHVRSRTRPQQDIDPQQGPLTVEHARSRAQFRFRNSVVKEKELELRKVSNPYSQLPESIKQTPDGTKYNPNSKE